MKTLTLILLGLSMGLSLVWADGDGGLGPTRYAPIAARNVFGLTAPEANVSQRPPPPKILVTGTMTIFSRAQVLFKVAPTQTDPGQRMAGSFHVLAENEEQDGVRVLRVDEDGGTITFSNHGVVQDVRLPDYADAVAAGGRQLLPPASQTISPRTNGSR